MPEILDYLDEHAGSRALLPRSGTVRRDALRIMVIASGAAEKGVSKVYESAFRPAEKWHQPWVDRCRVQMSGSLAAIDRHLGERGVSQWLVGKLGALGYDSGDNASRFLEGATYQRQSGTYHSLYVKLSLNTAKQCTVEYRASL